MTTGPALRTTVARMGVYTRGRKLYLRFQDEQGKWRNAPSGYDVGQEDAAFAVLEEVERRIAERRAADQVAIDGPGSVLLRDYAEQWLLTRKTATKDDDESRIRFHILPALGHLRLDQLRPSHIREFVKLLRTKTRQPHRRKDGTPIPTDELLAPRTVRHIYATLRVMLNDAVADEIIRSTPCVLKAGELPQKADKDRTWRRTAVFSRDEVEAIISAEVIPEDRRIFYALMFVGCTRFGEASALTWAHYDAAIAPLGKLVIERSYDSKTAEVKCTKTDNPREMPVHPTLAKLLAAWKLGGFVRLLGRTPKAGDLIVPSRRGKNRTARHMLRRFHEDLERVGLRPRRQHDTRRTFISIARAGGAGDLLRWCTHGPTADIMDVYTTPPWSALCAEVAKAVIERRAGELVQLPIAASSSSSEGAVLQTAVPVPFQSSEGSGKTGEKWRSGRDLNRTTSDSRGDRARRGEVIPMGSRRAGERGAATGTATSFQPVTRDAVVGAIAEIQAAWMVDRDRAAASSALFELAKKLRR